MYLRFTFTPNVPFTRHWQMKPSKMHATFTKSKALWNRCQKTDQNTIEFDGNARCPTRNKRWTWSCSQPLQRVCNICFNFCSFYVQIHINTNSIAIDVSNRYIYIYIYTVQHKQSVLIKLLYCNSIDTRVQAI